MAALGRMPTRLTSRPILPTLNGFKFQELPMAGLWFEELEVGRVYRHPITRTVTEMDNMLFSTLTMNPQPLHIDRHFAAQTEWGQPLMNSLFTLGLMVGISVNDLTVGTIVANLG